MNRILALATLAFVACERKETPTVTVDAVAPMIASAKLDAGAAPSAAARTAALKDLDEGRKLSKAKDWSKALEAFDRALVVMPDDARVLSEVGWAAFQANRLDRAEQANARALVNAREPLVRAPILYNVGRVAEARGKPEGARKAYKESLALRSNAEVKRRLEAVSADGSASDDEADRSPGDSGRLGCRQGFPDVLAMCRCLGAAEEGLFVPTSTKFVCARKPPAASLGEGRFTVVQAGGEVLGETAHLLAVHEAGRWRWLVNLGSDYEPGAFGVHNTAAVRGGTSRNVAGHTVVVVRSEQDDNDFNMAGLELCEYHAKLDTICALGDKAGETRCTPPIPVEAKSGCGPGLEPDTKDLDESTRWALQDIGKNATSKAVKAEWSIGDDGTVKVVIVSGNSDLLGPAARNPSPLWK